MWHFGVWFCSIVKFLGFGVEFLELQGCSWGLFPICDYNGLEVE